ncbi:MAG: histidine--tRNA ligase, partial [Candidatus Omnitrophica bacterium]|nr:histidine--tRNA ligase [Candidatus Omnitrophota bacterium]
MKRLKGTQDILPAEVGIWNFIEDISRQAFNTYRYKEIRTPIIEEESLFVRSVGSDTDIVKKQMYAFKDQGKRDIVLRPEETASVVRAYLENRLDKTEGFVKLFYIGPMFRSERPQAGRLRQFHQIGVEAIGSDSAYLDAEVIILLDSLLKGYGLSDYTLKINSLGCEKDKANAKELLKKELKADLSGLCDDCKRRYKTNILRILDCKVDACKKIVSSVSLKGLLCKECDADFKLLQNKLDEAGIKYEASSLLVRGLDYYTGIVFEVSSKKLGSQDALAAGGRYDNLVSDLGGERTGACGFAIGIERVIGALPASYLQEKAGEDRKGVFLATIGEEAYKKGFSLLCKL